MPLTIDTKLPKHIASVTKDVYQKINSLWPIHQQVYFTTCYGKTRNGSCTRLSSSNYVIRINKDLIRNEDIAEVVAHELLHSYPEVFDQNHKGEWKHRAQVANKTYGFHIKRTNSFERSQTYQRRPIKLQVECILCQRQWNYRKTPKWFAHISKVKCPYCNTETIQQINIEL